MPLPGLPGHEVSVVSESAPPSEARGFVYVRRVEARAKFASGETSEPFTYDIAARTRLDAVVVVPHYRGPDGATWVVLRSALRPPVALRPDEARPVAEPSHLGELWEVPAGLVEEDERSEEGLRRCAARELHEEAGFDVPPSSLQALGPSTFPAPGMIGERHFFFHVEVDPNERVAPPEDGSPLERHAVLADLSLEEALSTCRGGAIEDAKTELALRRLAEMFPSPRGPA